MKSNLSRWGACCLNVKKWPGWAVTQVWKTLEDACAWKRSGVDQNNMPVAGRGDKIDRQRK